MTGDPDEAPFKAAVLLQRAGRYAEAAAQLRDIVRRRPDLPHAADNLALALLGAGDYAEGFRLYERRFSREVGRVPRPRLSFPEWQGEPLQGRSILIWMEQGFGDQIMFARFAVSLAALGARVSILAPPPLARLFASLPADILVAEGELTVPRHDFWIMPGSIPVRLGTTLATLPGAPYLPGREGGAGFGVAWRGNPHHHDEPHRSLPAHLAAELLAMPGAVSLDPQDTGARDFEDTAEIVRGLKTVVSTCTGVAHLAGAMGKPLIVLLMAENCDWRWMSDRTDSMWYPSARLVRQPSPGDWSSVIAEVKRLVVDPNA